jgi:hypothetical protein
VALAGAALMTLAEERELLMDYARAMGDDDDTAEANVEGFLRQRRPGFTGYSDDELKGTARDEARVPPEQGT